MNQRRVISIDPDEINIQHLQQAADVVLSGGVIAYPTDTIYGLGANALDAAAVAKVFELKQRDKSRPILVIAYDLKQIENLVTTIPESAIQLAHHFWPGPLTIVFNASPKIASALLGPGNTIGIRIPDNIICQELLRRCGVPITSTSANISRGRNPVSIDDVIANFGDRLDLFIDGGVASSDIPSTVVDISTKKPIIRREGRIKKSIIEQTISCKFYENS
jgi:L-threonylcarbamoyladenylate synthase